MCFALCLLIAGAAFGATNLLKGGEAPPPSDNETVSSNEGFFQEDRGQNEEVSPIPGPVNSVDSISVDDKVLKCKKAPPLVWVFSANGGAIRKSV